ncbi:MAG: patatin-like phospholipase family protein [Bacteroidales bacterium]|nr:patatin-like phospholipase family protein [Bacteroidales bacterium]
MKNVALALSSGGPRGFAYIGAIEVLQERGYRITSVAGSSAGALVGGIFAAGGLEPFKEWLCGLDPVQVVSLMDFAPSRNSLVKGDKVIRAIKERVPDVRIEDLPVPFAAVASDLFTGEEVVFREGPLFTALRASISIPSMFRPVKWRGHTLVDGGLVNTFPLDLVERSEGDILVGFNVNRIDAESITSYMKTRAAITETGELLRERATDRLKDTLASEGALLDKVRKAGRAGGQMIRERIDAGRLDRRLEAAAREKNIPLDAADSYASVLQRSFGIMNHTIARLQIDLYKPDILVNLPFDSYHGVYGYSHAGEIVEKGRALMSAAFDSYEAQAD